MPKPIPRRELLRRFKALGWEGPYSGGKHSFMCKENLKVRVPNPHGSDIDWSLTKRILLQAGISTEEWDGV
jgi:predicted RNA binding protein YcfA (HicA-like mRNA interferase family)